MKHIGRKPVPIEEQCGAPTQTCLCGHNGHAHRYARCESCDCQGFQPRPCRFRKGRCADHEPERFFQLEPDPPTPEQIMRWLADEELKRIQNGLDPTQCGVYFIRCGQFIKIGKSTDFRKRFAALQIASPHDLTVVAFKACPTYLLSQTEARFHRKFKRLHHRGEWFRLTPALERFLQTIQSDGQAA